MNPTALLRRLDRRRSRLAALAVLIVPLVLPTPAPAAQRAVLGELISAAG